MRDIDHIIQELRAISPEIVVHQLEVVHPGADDDGLWFFRVPDGRIEVQLESSSGTCPFLVEGNRSEARGTASTISEAVGFVIRSISY
jgi:hypothetical protein